MKTQTIFPVLLFICLLFSCTGNNGHVSVKSLTQARDMIEEHPSDALTLLDSISNPQDMDQEHYMLYHVLLVQAKYKCYKDITGDTLIFEAQKFFSEKGDMDNAALASYYAGCVCYEQGVKDRALIYYLNAERFALQVHNNSLAGRSLNNIGFLYFERDIFNEAIIRFHQALNYFKTETEETNSKLHTINLLGRTFDAMHNNDSAYAYFNKGLILAEELNNIPYQAAFSKQLGFVLYQKGDYKKASSLMKGALLKTSNLKDSITIYLNLSILYNSNKELDSARYYVNTIQEYLGKTVDNYVLLEIYKSLAKYYEETNNYQEVSHYYKLQKEVSDKISEANSSEKLTEAEKKYQLSLQQKELQSSQMRSYLYSSASLITLLISYFLYRNNKQKRQHEAEKNKYLESQNQLLTTRNQLLETENKLFDIKIKEMSFLQSIYKNFIEEWTSIEKEVKDLVAQYQASGKPTIYLRIIKMIEDVKEKTNKQLIDSAKELLLSKPSGDKALKVLMDKDLLLLMACYNGYYKINEIAYIMGVAPSSSNLYMQKLDIRNKLERTGVLDAKLYNILFCEEERAKNIHV